jgi:lysophospholipase L1-like esterase
MIRRPFVRLALMAMAAVPLFAACSLDNQVMGVRGSPPGGSQFARVANIGTSLSSGFESGGINDSTQREGPMYQLAVAIGLTPGVDWFYPSFQSWGCPAPYTNPLTGARVGGVSAAFCGTRAAASAVPYMSNTAIPGLRAGHVLDLTYLAFPKTDTLKLAQFITGGVNPINMVLRQQPTFVTIEVGANDVLGASTNADTTLLTPVAAFTQIIGAIRDSLNTLNPRPGVAIANLPSPGSIPHFTKASTLYTLKNVTCPALPGALQAGIPYCSPLFTLDATCNTIANGGVGDAFLLPLATTGAITSVLAAARAAKIDCGRDSVLVAIAGGGAPAVANAGLRLNVPAATAIGTRVAQLNGAIAALATTENWALADVNAAFLAQAANIPVMPDIIGNQLKLYGCPSTLIGGAVALSCTGTTTLFSQDGLHMSKAGYRVMAVAFATAINAKYGSALVVP